MARRKQAQNQTDTIVAEIVSKFTFQDCVHLLAVFAVFGLVAVALA